MAAVSLAAAPTLTRTSSPFRPFSSSSISGQLQGNPRPGRPASSQLGVTSTSAHAPMVNKPSSACPHVGQAVLSNAQTLDRYNLALKWGRKQEARMLAGKQTHSKCSICGHAPPRPAICLECGEMACLANGHARKHLDKTRHRFYVDSHSGAMFCLACNDTVYHHLVGAPSPANNSASPMPIAGVKRKRTDYKTFRPNAEAKVLVAHSAKLRSCDNVRGIRNLGATCFLNVVLQALLHNPLVKGYFLADRHSMALCPIAQRPEGGVCILCEVDKIFSEMYGNASASQPFGPTSLLQASWTSFRDMAGYSQQDAHEYLIATLDAMHRSTPGASDSAQHCPCIVHTTFAGELRSEVKCTKCGNINTALDPFLDLSLDIQPPSDLSGPAGTEQASTLFQCLKRYTSSEKLGSRQYSCTSCGTASTDATKRLSINILPPVLCIQLKRFEHAAASRKVDTRVRFPLQLDMGPYTAGRSAANATYELFAVVTHEGKLDTGHYYMHARRRDNWTLINDDVVTPTPLSSVLATNPYLLFYARTALDYAQRVPKTISA